MPEVKQELNDFVISVQFDLVYELLIEGQGNRTTCVLAGLFVVCFLYCILLFDVEFTRVDFIQDVFLLRLNRREVVELILDRSTRV